MGKIAEAWEPFEIQVNIEGNSERLLIIPDMGEAKYEVFDSITSIGKVWKDKSKQGPVWCAEGMVARELLDQIGEQIDAVKQVIRIVS